jgi:hypothetical protein
MDHADIVHIHIGVSLVDGIVGRISDSLSSKSIVLLSTGSYFQMGWTKNQDLQVVCLK